MLRNIKKIIKDFFSLSKYEQYGIITLLILIMLTSLLYFLLPYFIKLSPETDDRFIEIAEIFSKQQNTLADSIRINRIQSSGQLDETLARKRLHPFPFDPNKLPEELWKKIGLTEKQIRIIKNYEAKGGKFFRKEDLKKLYCISDAEYKVLEPYIQIKSGFKTTGNQIIKHNKKTFFYRKTELNRADTMILKANLNIPFWMGKRIIKYRKKLGGFFDNSQLLEVYGMKEKYFALIKPYVWADTTQIEKICINQAGFKQLLKHPYCDYQLTKKIIQIQKKQGGFKSLQQVRTITGNSGKGGKLYHYLYICPPDLSDDH